jgi:hypothetical protein
MLRKLDAMRLEQLLLGAERLDWDINAKVRDDQARKFLKDLETAIENFRLDLRRIKGVDRARETLSLRLQLEPRKTADDVAACLERLAGHRFALLGADYLFWKCKITAESDEEWAEWSKLEYRSSNIVFLSIEPFGTPSRRAHIDTGEVPSHQPIDTAVYVNGIRLPSEEEL